MAVSAHLISGRRDADRRGLFEIERRMPGDGYFGAGLGAEEGRDIAAAVVVVNHFTGTQADKGTFLHYLHIA